MCCRFKVGYSLGVSIRLAGSSRPLPRVDMAMLLLAAYYILAIECVMVEQDGLCRPPEPKAFQTSWLVSLWSPAPPFTFWCTTDEEGCFSLLLSLQFLLVVTPPRTLNSEFMDAWCW